MRLRSVQSVAAPIWRALSATGKYLAAAPGPVQNFAVAKFAQYSRIDVRRADAEMRSELRAEPCGVEDRTGPDHPFGRHPATAGDHSGNLGQVATRKIGAAVAANTAGAISTKISALRDSKSNRLSPGLSLVPAASTTTRAPSRWADCPARTGQDPQKA